MEHTIATTEIIQTRQQALAAKTVELLTEHLGLPSNEADNMEFLLNRTNFTEIWFPGPFGQGLYIRRSDFGVPQVEDKRQQRSLASAVESVNVALYMFDSAR